MLSPFQFEADELKPVVDALRTLAHAARKRLPAGETLATTALVNEVYLKLSRTPELKVQDRRHFFALAARAMRELLINAAQSRQTRQHLAPTVDAQTDDFDVYAPALSAEQLVAMDQALQALAKIHPRLADVVMCRFFAGYTEVETAEIFAVDVRTVQRDWQRARTWLAQLGFNA